MGRILVLINELSRRFKATFTSHRRQTDSIKPTRWREIGSVTTLGSISAAVSALPCSGRGTRIYFLTSGWKSSLGPHRKDTKQQQCRWISWIFLTYSWIRVLPNASKIDFNSSPFHVDLWASLYDFKVPYTHNNSGKRTLTYSASKLFNDFNSDVKEYFTASSLRTSSILSSIKCKLRNLRFFIIIYQYRNPSKKKRIILYWTFNWKICYAWIVAILFNVIVFHSANPVLNIWTFSVRFTYSHYRHCPYLFLFL